MDDADFEALYYGILDQDQDVQLQAAVELLMADEMP